MVTKNVLIISLDWTKVGGAENYAINLKQGLEELGHNVTIMSYVNSLDVNSNYDILLDKNTNFNAYKSLINSADIIYLNGAGNYLEDKKNTHNYLDLIKLIGKSNAIKFLMIHGPRQFTHTPLFNKILKNAKIDLLLTTRQSVIKQLDNYLDVNNKHYLDKIKILEIPVDLSNINDFVGLNLDSIVMTSRVTPYKHQDKLIKLCNKVNLNAIIYGFNKNTTNQKELQYYNKLKQLGKFKHFEIFTNEMLPNILSKYSFHANLSDYSDKNDDLARETTTIEAIKYGCIPIVSKQTSDGFTHLKDAFIIDIKADLTQQAKELKKFMQLPLYKLKKIHNNAIQIIKVHDRINIANKLIQYAELINQNKTGVDFALEKVLAIRKNRRQIYGDGFLTAKDRHFVTMILEKVNRMETIYEAGNNNYEKLEDTLIDLTNYALMYLEVLLRRS